MFYAILLLGLPHILVRKVYASSGDLDQTFRLCSFQCVSELGCPQQPFAVGWVYEPCFGCRQTCIWGTVDLFLERYSGKFIPQFYGKWPFAPYSLPFLTAIPMQEPASVIFSLWNMLAAFKLYRGASKLPRTFSMRDVWRMYALVAIVTWIFSAIFHWSDFWVTEYLDYFSAFAVILFAFFASVSLVISPFWNRRFVVVCWRFLFLGLLYLFWKHIRSLMIRFDYGYNMQCCLFYSFFTALIYGLWIAFQYTTRSKSIAGRQSLIYLSAAVILGLASGGFETIQWVIDSSSRRGEPTIR